MTDNKPPEMDRHSDTDSTSSASSRDAMASPGATGAASGMAGRGVVDAVNPTAEDSYWRANYAARPYANKHTKYETLQPAYRYGWESHSSRGGKKWRDVEQDLSNGWEKARGISKLAWNDAKQAVRDAWDRTGGDKEPADRDEEQDGAMRNGAARDSGDDATGKKRV